MTFFGMEVNPIEWAFLVMLTVLLILGIMEKLMPGDDDE